MSRSYRTGLVLLGVCPSSTSPAARHRRRPPADVDRPHRPARSVLASLACVVAAWRGERRARAAAGGPAGSSSVLTAVPAFFVDDVPSGIVALAAGFVLVTLVGVALVGGAASARR